MEKAERRLSGKEKETGPAALPDARFEALIGRTGSEPDLWQSGSWLVHSQAQSILAT